MKDPAGDRESDFFPVVIAALAVLSYGRIYFFQDIVWDDNCWLLSAYTSSGLKQFLDTGFFEMRRAPMGVYLYYLLSLHKASNHPYLFWHSLNLLVQVLSPVVLYLFLKNLFERRAFALLAAISFVVFPLDGTLPYLCSTVYRSATLFIVTSFYLTERYLARDPPRWSFLAVALLLTGIAEYVFMELTVFLEAARLFVIGYLCFKRGFRGGDLLQRAVGFWAPFLLLSLPLVVYKSLYKPYGIYKGLYSIDKLFFIRWGEHTKVVRILLFQQWQVLSGYLKEVTVWSVALGLMACAGFLFLIRQIPRLLKGEAGTVEGSPRLSWLWVPLSLGMICLMPLIILLELAGREIGPGMNSNHFNQLQIGYAIILGCLLYLFYRRFSTNYQRSRACHWLLSLLIGLGVFFNNLNLDLYLHATDKQKGFWRAFTTRFPSLPADAVFMMDVRDFYFFDAADLDNTYDLELVLNLLYAQSEDPGAFRKYRVVAVEELTPALLKQSCSQLRKVPFERITHFGKEVLNPCDFIFVKYQNQEILVNDEILRNNPEVRYRGWIGKDPPGLRESGKPDSSGVRRYLLRHKLEGFY